MRAFSQATKADFEDLDRILDDGQLHVYNNRELPDGCVPRIARIGFEKEGEIYSLFIDNGIKTTIQNCDFAFWIDKGETRFVGLDDLMAFFYSIRSLFNENQSIQTEEGREGTNTAVASPSAATEEDSVSGESTQTVINRNRLKEIKSKRTQVKEVWPEDIARAIKKNIFGQDVAIDALAEGIAINQMKTEAKAYVALLLGPPASGKTETGTMLSKVLTDLYEREYGFIKIDCNTYRGEHMIQNILGAPPSYVGYGKDTVLQPVRKNPYHVILFDEIEKAHEDLLVALMEALDTGYLTMADNSAKIDLTKCIILFTSNIPMDMKEYNGGTEYERDEMCKDLFTKHCGRPEISRRIKDFLVFVPISDDAVVDVIIKFAKKSLANYGAQLVHIDEELMDDFLRSKTKYGASEIANRVEKALGRVIIKSHNKNLINGMKVSVKGTPDDITLEIVEERSME